MSYLRSNFNADIAGISPAPLTGETRKVVERILGRQYPKVEEINRKKFKIRRTSDSGYTSFNMGAGEDSLIALLAQLSQLPKGSLVVIDEVETALHPAAQRKLVEALLQLSWERKLQIIGSTGLKEDDAAQRLVRCAVGAAKNQLEPLIDQIQQMLA